MDLLKSTPKSWKTMYAAPPDDITGAQLVVLRPGSAGRPTLAVLEYGVHGNLVWPPTILKEIGKLS